MTAAPMIKWFQDFLQFPLKEKKVHRHVPQRSEKIAVLSYRGPASAQSSKQLLNSVHLCRPRPETPDREPRTLL